MFRQLKKVVAVHRFSYTRANHVNKKAGGLDLKKSHHNFQ